MNSDGEIITRDEWIGRIQSYLEWRMGDAPDATCKALVENLWQQTAEWTFDHETE